MRWFVHPVCVVAIVFATLHVLLVAVPVVTSSANGEAQAFAVLVFDFPLVWILRQSDWGLDILYGNLGATGKTIYMLIFSIGATIFWAGLSSLLTYVITRLFRRRTNAVSRRVNRHHES